MGDNNQEAGEEVGSFIRKPGALARVVEEEDSVLPWAAENWIRAELWGVGELPPGRSPPTLVLATEPTPGTLLSQLKRPCPVGTPRPASVASCKVTGGTDPCLPLPLSGSLATPRADLRRRLGSRGPASNSAVSSSSGQWRPTTCSDPTLSSHALQKLSASPPIWAADSVTRALHM